MTNRTLFPRAFGLRMPAPLWTAPAYDRCLLLALLYPIAAIFSFWAVSGHVGPAESAFGLAPDISIWRRGLFTAMVGFSELAMWRSARAVQRNLPLLYLVWFVGATVAAIVGAATATATTAAAVTVTATVVGTGFFANVGFAAKRTGAAGVVFAVLFGLSAGIFDPRSAAGTSPVAIGLIGAAALAAQIAANVLPTAAVKYRRHGLLLLLFSVGMIVVCLCAAHFLPVFFRWQVTGPLLLFLGLLTLLNAPFDWASLGLTRALLRRGLELGGWWPYFLAAVDAILAASIVALLAITMVLGVQTFDYLAEHGGGSGILPLDQLLNGVAAHPSAQEYWWLYALLLSSMIPSLINLMIGGASLVSGVPGVPSLILRFMPVGRAVAPFDRNWIALLLTVQAFIGAGLGIAAQVFLAVVVIFCIMPWIGLGLLDTAREVADFDLPGRVLPLLWGGQ